MQLRIKPEDVNVTDLILLSKFAISNNSYLFSTVYILHYLDMRKKESAYPYHNGLTRRLNDNNEALYRQAMIEESGQKKNPAATILFLREGGINW